jgi:hypothetical protein
MRTCCMRVSRTRTSAHVICTRRGGHGKHLQSHPPLSIDTVTPHGAPQFRSVSNEYARVPATRRTHNAYDTPRAQSACSIRSSRRQSGERGYSDELRVGGTSIVTGEASHTRVMRRSRGRGRAIIRCRHGARRRSRGRSPCTPARRSESDDEQEDGRRQWVDAAGCAEVEVEGGRAGRVRLAEYDGTTTAPRLRDPHGQVHRGPDVGADSDRFLCGVSNAARDVPTLDTRAKASPGVVAS